MRTGYVAIFKKGEKFRCLYSYYGSGMPSSPKGSKALVYYIITITCMSAKFFEYSFQKSIPTQEGFSSNLIAYTRSLRGLCKSC